MQQQYDAAYWRREAYRQHMWRDRRRTLVHHLRRQWRHLLQQAWRPFCRHANTVNTWMRDHPDYYWITGRHCWTCGRNFMLETPEKVLEPQEAWRP